MKITNSIFLKKLVNMNFCAKKFYVFRIEGKLGPNLFLNDVRLHFQQEYCKYPSKLGRKSTKECIFVILIVLKYNVFLFCNYLMYMWLGGGKSCVDLWYTNIRGLFPTGVTSRLALSACAWANLELAGSGSDALMFLHG